MQNQISEQKRSSGRIDTRLPVGYAVGADPVFHFNEAINISKGGLFICTADPLEAGTSINVSIPVQTPTPPLGEHRVIVKAKVVHKRTAENSSGRKPAGMGVAFLDFKENDWRAVLRKVSKLLIESGVVTATRTWTSEEETGREIIKSFLPAVLKEFTFLLEEIRSGHKERVDPGEMSSEETQDSLEATAPLPRDSRCRRIEVQLPAKIRTSDGEQLVHVLDLSETGAGFVSRHQIAEQDELALALGRRGKAPVLLRGRVVWKRPLFSKESPQYCYGMSFSESSDQYDQYFSSI